MRFKEQLVARPGDEAKTPAEKKVLILSWLKKNNFHNCIVNDDGEVDSPTSIDLGMMRFKASSYAGLKSVLPKFGTIHGSFDASTIGATELLGWCPHTVTEACNLNNNHLSDLRGAPNTVNGKFDVAHNELSTFEGAPRLVDAFAASGNNLSSFEGCTPDIGMYLDIRENKFKSLKDINKHVKKLDGFLAISGNDITSHVMGVFLIEGLTSLQFNRGDQRWAEIVNDHLSLPDRNPAIIECQHLLIEAGYEELAQI